MSQSAATQECAERVLLLADEALAAGSRHNAGILMQCVHELRSLAVQQQMTEGK